MGEDEIFMTRRQGLHAARPGYTFAPPETPARTPLMRSIIRKTLTHPTLALGSAALWGLIELVALNRFWRSGR